MAQPETTYQFNGIGYVEERIRYDQHRTGVPSNGDMRALLTAPAKPSESSGRANFAQTVEIRVQNVGGAAAEVRARHGESVKAEAAEILTAQISTVTNTKAAGSLLRKSLVPGSFSMTDSTGTPQVAVDDGDGLLLLQGTSTVIGSINYAKGSYEVTFPAAIAGPLTASYNHTDYVDFAVANTETLTIAAGLGLTAPLNLQPQIFGFNQGILNPRSVAITGNSGETFVDDGKGNIIQTSTGNNVVGSVDYASGSISITAAAADLAAGNITLAYAFNPMGKVLVSGGSARVLQKFDNQDYVANAYAVGLISDDRVALVGQSMSSEQTNLISDWGHMGDQPYRVEDPYSGFPAGGRDNDPLLS